MKWLYGQLDGIKRFIRFINIFFWAYLACKMGIDPTILITSLASHKSIPSRIDAGEWERVCVCVRV